MTILEVKKFIFEKLKVIFKDVENKFTCDEDINEHLLIHVFDNVPYEKNGPYQRKLLCEFCEEKHG